MRQDPDVILVGELRDVETLRMALRAADTGHQVFATVHSSRAAQTIERIIAQEGATLADVVRATTYLQDTRDFGRYNKVFGEMFKDAILARTTVEARAVINTKIEIECIVYKPLKK